MRSVVFSVLLLLITQLLTGAAMEFDVLAELQGTLPGDPTGLGDQYGIFSTIGGPNAVVVGAPLVSSGTFIDNGALYFYGLQRGEWQPSQSPFTGVGSYDQVSELLAVARGDWLVVSCTGTPLFQNNPYYKDFSGAVCVFHRNGGEWTLRQNITNPLGSEAGAFSFFGANVNFDGQEWMVVGGLAVSNAWFYRLNCDTNLFELTQMVTPPSIPATPAGYVFVSISPQGIALIGQPFVKGQTSNSATYVYTLNQHTGLWSNVQTLQGFDNPINPAFNTADQFGEFTSISGNWAVIGAPYDGQLGGVQGAAYVYKWQTSAFVFKQKLFSDKPTTLFGFTAAVSGNLILVSDSPRTVNGHPFQGAVLAFGLMGNTWNQIDVLTDPGGRAYDYFGAGGLDINAGMAIAGGCTFCYNYVPVNSTIQPTFQFPLNNGRAVLYGAYD
jgi:FG-GAP repeat